MSERRGSGDPPAYCTCLLSHWFNEDGEHQWAVQVVDDDCPHHGTPVRYGDANDE